MPDSAPTYRGRFAPSPTGPLHLGSLITALASFLEARAHDGEWLVRMEDLDPPREEPGAAQRILAGLQAHGLHTAEAILFQHQRSDAYAAALDQLAAAGHLFACDCTRANSGPNGRCGGHCRQRQQDLAAPCALRVAIPEHCILHFEDALLGEQREDLSQTLGDFVVKRKDGLYAYQLAVVVDDAQQQITHVLRGSDLLDSTLRQIALQKLLGFPTPHYCHLPVITTAAGQKFSKQNQAPALDDTRAVHNLRLALRFLNQPAAPETITEVPELLAFAGEHWRLENVPAQASVPAAEIGLTL